MNPNEIAALLPPHLELGEKLGEGGVATVYRVKNTKLDTHWALKVFESNRVTSSGGITKALREARLTAVLHHPNVVTIHDVDETNGFIFMELVDGPSLSELAKTGVESQAVYIEVCGGILAGLAEAHRNGIVHGDISSRNILFTKSRIPKLVDFGFARHVEFSSSSVGMTPGFASPEHVLDKRITMQSDVFSVASVLYLLGTGSYPFHWESFHAYAYAILNERPQDPVFSFPEPAPFLAPIIMRALAREQRDRYPSAVEMETAFRSRNREAGKIPVSIDRTLPVGRALRHYHRGLEYYRGTSRQEMDWAEHEFRKALEYDPTLALAYAGLADIAIFRYMSYFDRSLVALARAEHYCLQALSMDSERPQTHRSLGRIHMMRRDYPAARECFKKAIALDPDYLAAHLSLGWCEVDAHELKAAEEAALTAQAIIADDVEVGLLLARIYYYRKEYDRSMAVANEAISANRRFGRAYYELAMAERALGELDQATDNFQRSIEYQGDPNALTDLGILELYRGELESAQQAFDRAAQEGTFAFLALYYSGLTHRLRRDSAKADTLFQQSAILTDQLAKNDPSDPYARALGAMAAAALGNTVRADSLRAIAREIDSRDGLVAFYSLCAESWSPANRPSKESIGAVLTLPRSPSQIEVSLDPHFTGRLWEAL